MLAEAAVPALAAGQEALVSFDFPTADRPGDRTLFVVADAAEQVPESREDDNTRLRTLTVVGLLADLVSGLRIIAVVPAAPEIGEDAVDHRDRRQRRGESRPRSSRSRWRSPIPTTGPRSSPPGPSRPSVWGRR